MICATTALAALLAAGPALFVGMDAEVATVQGRVARPRGWAVRRLARVLSVPDELGDSRIVYAAQPGKGVNAQFLKRMEPFFARGGSLVVSGKCGDLGLKLVRDEAVPLEVQKAPVGKGWVYCLPQTLEDYILSFARRREPLGEADAEGVFRPTAAGQAVEAAVAYLTKVFAAAEPEAGEAVRSSWGLQPLGKPGTFVAPTTLPNRPTFRPRRTWAPAVPFADGVIACPENPPEIRSLAQELKYHLDILTGRDVRLVADADTETLPAIVFESGKGPVGESRLKLDGRRLVLSGRSRGELSRALTYLLEAEGCRYLWPGKLGKVIPRNPAFALRAFDVAFTPTFKVRELRGAAYRTYKGKVARVGITDEEHREYETIRAAAAIDHPGNRPFDEWHGCNDGRDLPGKLNWGHYFGDYYPRFHVEHPEYFALQPDGTRDLDLSRYPERPRLCLSNEGLARQAAADVLADFRRQPDLYGHSICLPDGGPGNFCLCEDCRRRDPVNGKRTSLWIGAPLSGRYGYVSLTDRVLAFNNRVAELVTKELPWAKLTMYAYSNYVEPPLAVKPHPSLIVLSCAGNYTCGDDDAAERSVAGWAGFGCPLFWRPNSFIGFRTSAPQVHARQLFHDFELLKANGVIGVDESACNEMWANRGYDAYVTMKAIFNPDRLDYAAHRADWLEKGFGPAAEMVGAYLDRLDEICREPGKLSGATVTWVDRERAFERAFDLPGLRALLAKATEAADADVIRARIAFLARGLDVAEADIVLSFDHTKADEEKFVRLLKERCRADPLVWNPNWYGSAFYGIHLGKGK